MQDSLPLTNNKTWQACCLRIKPGIELETCSYPKKENLRGLKSLRSLYWVAHLQPGMSTQIVGGLPQAFLDFGGVGGHRANPAAGY